LGIRRTLFSPTIAADVERVAWPDPYIHVHERPGALPLLEAKQTLYRDISGRGGMHQLRWNRAFLPRRMLWLLLLDTLSKEPGHGYDLIKRTGDRFNGMYSPSPGVVYPTLQKMAIDKLVTVREESDGRKTYSITRKGRNVLKKNRHVIDMCEALRSDPNWKAKAKLLRSVWSLVHKVASGLKDMPPSRVEALTRLIGATGSRVDELLKEES